jgi:IS5 family transposase
VKHPADEAPVRGRGGFSAKPHLSCDGRGRPLPLTITAGRRNECTRPVALLEGLPDDGRPAHHLADRGYAHDSRRRALRRAGHSPHHPRAPRPARAS